MPGEATQRIVLCTPYAVAGAHDPHPVTTVEDVYAPEVALGGQAWCPGNPPQYPDGSPVTGDDVREQAVPLAGEFRALTDEVRAAQADVAAREVTAGEPAAPRDSTRLQAEEYLVTVSGVRCRVLRRLDDGLHRPVSGAPAWWEAHIGRASAHETTVPSDRGEPVSKLVDTTARFAFNPDDLDSEEVALERAGSYCEQVARALWGLWQEQERIYEQVTGAVARARAVCGALPGK